MTYLELCQAVHRLLRVGNGEPGTQPTSVSSQTGTLAEIVEWVKQAWLDIQGESQLWRFLIGNATYNVTSGTRSVARTTLNANLAEVMPFWVHPHFRFILAHETADSTAAQWQIEYVHYQNWIGNIGRTPQQSGRPNKFTITPSGGIELDPTPNVNITLTFQMRRTAQTLSGNTDDPANAFATGQGLRTEHHMAIVWRAIEYYCLTRPDSDRLMVQARDKYNEMMSTIRTVYLPELVWDERMMS